MSLLRLWQEHERAEHRAAAAHRRKVRADGRGELHGQPQHPAARRRLPRTPHDAARHVRQPQDRLQSQREYGNSSGCSGAGVTAELVRWWELVVTYMYIYVIYMYIYVHIYMYIYPTSYHVNLHVHVCDIYTYF